MGGTVGRLGNMRGTLGGRGTFSLWGTKEENRKSKT